MTATAVAMPAMSELAVNVSEKRFNLEPGDRPILRDVKFSVSSGEFFTVLGPSGCGKSTLLRLIAGLDLDYKGEIFAHGKLVVGPSRERGLVFQEARLLPWLSVRENIEFGLPDEETPSRRVDRILDVIRLMGLEDAAERWPRELSGGMAKRAALARAIINLPSLLLLDEPFAGLDTLRKFELQDCLKAILDKEKTTVILVTHDVDEAIFLSDRIVFLSSSPACIVEEVQVPLGEPRSRDSREFNLFRADLLGRMLRISKFGS